MNLILYALYWIFPAYVANAVPVMIKGKTPLDFKKNFIDKKRVLGDGKTIEGTLLGIVLGSFVGFLMGRPEIGILLSLGAIFGDVVASFLKRRINFDRGEHLWGVDQLDFVLGAILFAGILEFPEIKLVLIVLIITPVIHLATNYLAYKLKLKKVPY